MNEKYDEETIKEAREGLRLRDELMRKKYESNPEFFYKDFKVVPGSLFWAANSRCGSAEIEDLDQSGHLKKLQQTNKLYQSMVYEIGETEADLKANGKTADA